MSDWVTNLVEQMGYFGVALLMFLENLFPPIPSELVMPLAGFTASDGSLNIFGVVIAGTLGSLAGAVVWYFIGRRVGEEHLERWAANHGRWITLGPSDIDRVDRKFQRHGGWMVVLGRLVPAIRTLISIPAGIFHMPFPKFLLLSGIGTFAWTAALAAAGYALGSQYDNVQNYVAPATYVVIGAMLIWYVYRVITFDGGKRAGRRR